MSLQQRPASSSRRKIQQSQSLTTRQSKSLKHSIPRASPSPEVSDPFCRLPLPTLFYRLEAFHLGDLMRLCVQLEMNIYIPQFFHGTCQKHRTIDKVNCSSNQFASSPAKPIPKRIKLLKRKENSSQVLTCCQLVQFCRQSIPFSTAGILTCFPFEACGIDNLQNKLPTFTSITKLLRIGSLTSH